MKLLVIFFFTENRITFKIKREYYLELLTSETMKVT